MQTDKYKDIALSPPFWIIFCDTNKLKSCNLCRPRSHALAWMGSLNIYRIQDFSVQGQIQSMSASFFLSSIIIVCISDLTLQSLLNGLMCYKPDDPIEYLESCLQKVKELGGSEKVKWDTFVSPEKKALPPLNGGQSRRSFFRNGNVLSMKIFIFSVLWMVLHPLLTYFILTSIADRVSFWSSLGKGLSFLFTWVFTFGFLLL